VLDTGTIGCQKAGGGSPTATPTPTPTASSPTSTPTSTPTSDPAAATPTPTATPTSTTGTSLTILPAADAYVNSGSPTSNYGSATTLREDASPDLHSYIKFDLSGVTFPITKATLRLYANSTSSTGVNINGVTDNSWVESTINYNNAPAFNPTPAGSSGSISQAGVWISVDITALINTSGLVSVAVTTTNATAISLASRETGANAPQLVIQY
jgi:hypothetical protein